MSCALPPLDEWGDTMTDARFPDRWLARRSFVGLPEPAFKLYVLSMMWAVSNRTDGAISVADLDYVPCPSGPDLRAELVAADMWQVKGRDSWTMPDFPTTTQTSAAQLAASEAYAARERERRAVERAAKKVAKRTSPQDGRATTQGQDSESDRTGEAVREGSSRTVPSQRPRPLPDDGWDD